MDQAQLNWITNFIWGIADDVLRDLFVRGKYRDVILPMTRPAPPRRRARADQAGRARHEGHARQEQASPIRTTPCARPPARRSTTPRSSPCATSSPAPASRQLKADFEAYLDGFSPNVQDILDNFEFRNQIPTPLQGRRARARSSRSSSTRTSTSAPAPRGRAARPRQPRHGHGLRGTGPPLQRGEQRGGRRALDAARRRPADGEPHLPAHRRRRSSPAPTCSTTAPAAPAAC